jgi:hypothetical protein
MYGLKWIDRSIHCKNLAQMNCGCRCRNQFHFLKKTDFLHIKYAWNLLFSQSLFPGPLDVLLTITILSFVFFGSARCTYTRTGFRNLLCLFSGPLVTRAPAPAPATRLPPRWGNLLIFPLDFWIHWYELRAASWVSCTMFCRFLAGPIFFHAHLGCFGWILHSFPQLNHAHIL